jgi:LytS/YehU family sensor histidine kinase
MILQPLVENAIQYGVVESRGNGWIEISARKITDALELRIRNSTNGSRQNGSAVGLRNTESHLKFLYASEVTLSFIVKEELKAITNLRFPALHSNFSSTFQAASQPATQTR